jgi:predicted transcriptional regulator
MSPENKPPISAAEMEILSIIWNLQAATVQAVCDQLPPNRNIAYATVQTLLRRLERKGYVTHTVQGKAHLFRAAVQRQAVVHKSVGDFVERLFGGDPAPLMLHLARHGNLKQKDLEQLKQLLQSDENRPSVDHNEKG